MTTSTKTSPSRDKAYHLQREVDKLASHYKTLRNEKTTKLLQTDKLDKGKVTLAYDLRSVEAAIAYLDTAERALRDAHIQLAMVKEDGDAD
jgi:hypothetical protein